ncbi:MAG TPA: hypothetical protein VNS09_25680 [Solirubrobacter sp.]|nr:hypothetical protein [Solirubrobacter sp.]
MATLRITCALALGLLGLGAATAHAGQSQSIETERGSVRFEHYGEILTAYAGPYAGGRGIRAYLDWTDRGRKHAVVTALQGAGGTGTASKNLSIREGTTVYLRMCYTNLQNEDTRCSKRQRGVA